MNVFKTSLIAAALIAAGAAAPATAADNMAFDVTITIDKSCDVTSTSDVAFGSTTASAGTVTGTGGNVTVQCTVDVPYDIALDAGDNGANVGARKMLHTNGTDAIPYQLYQDAGFSTVWGDTVDTNTVEGTGTGFGTGTPYDQPHTVYAQATVPGTAPVGSYSDTITATVTF